MITTRALLAVVAAGALVLSGAPARADGPPPPWPGGTGPANPRGLTFAPYGTRYVAGSSDPCPAGPVCSGTVTRFAHGHQRRVVKRLPSPAARSIGEEASGPSDVAVDRQGRVYFTVGLAGNPDLRTQLRQLRRSGPAAPGDLGAYGKEDLGAYGKKDLGAYGKKDLSAYGKKVNPDRVVAVGDGRLVADAGGNSLVRMSPRGRLSTVAVFPSRTVPAPAVPGGPPAGTPILMESVPTAVVTGPDGALYVGELTGFPFVPGQARVWRVVPGHRPQVYATGFTTIIDLAWGADRRLYVLEIARNGLLSGDRTGALLRAGRNGRHEVVASAGLTAPGGLALRGRSAYLSDCSTCAGGGSVLRVRLG
jgi:hypothetical protein